MTKTPGQLAYEADVAARPKYHDGTPRRPWADLCPIARWSWERPAKAPNAPPFIEWARRQIGSNWVIARRTARIVERYGADVVCLTQSKYKALREQYRDLYGEEAP